jgi:lipopolysaccharide transport system permease protein
MRVGMFLTPVFWVYDGAGGVRGAFYHWNPFTYFLEIVRAPILTGEPPIFALALCLTIALGLWTLALLLLGRFRRELVFVL